MKKRAAHPLTDAEREPAITSAWPAEATEQLRFALEAMPVGFSVFDADDRLQLWNERLFQIWPYAKALRVRGADFAELMATIEHREIEHPDCPSRPLGVPGRRRREYVLGDGTRIEVHVDRLEDGSTVAVHEDVTDRRADEARIRFLANHDSLTGLPNRTSLNAAMQRLLQTGAWADSAVLYLDLDRFKAVNDTLGHAAGDLLLIAAARRLGRRIVDELSRPFDVDGRTATIGASIGIALSDSSSCEPDVLLRQADHALYRAKQLGRGRVVVHERGKNPAPD